jgi:hypothetical protein
MGLVEEEAVVTVEAGMATGESGTGEGVVALEGETGWQKVVRVADLAGREGLVGLVAAPSRKQ